MVETNDFYEKFYEYLLNDPNDNDNTSSFPVGKIDNLPCLIMTKPFIKGELKLFIKIPYRDKILFKSTLRNKEDLQTFIVNLKKMKFNNFIGKFELEMKLPEFKNIFESDNIETSYKECVVCYELTANRTRCNHEMCLRCETSMVIKNNHNCPICRRCFLFPPCLQDNAISDDDSDEEDEN